MGLTELISGIFKPAADLIDNLHTSEEERLEIKQAMFNSQMQAAIKAQEYESELLKSKTDIIIAEAKGGSYIQRNWRPITMLTFLFLVVLDSFGWLPNPLAAEAWLLLHIGIGGYVAGRSVEKAVPKVAQMMRKD